MGIRKKLLLLFAVTFSFFNSNSQTNEYINPRRNTVLIELQSKYGTYIGGIGFIIHDNIIERNFLVTSRKILLTDTIILIIEADQEIRNYFKSKINPALMYNSVLWYLEGACFKTKISLSDKSRVFKHPSLDLAIIPLNFGTEIELNGSKIKAAKIGGFILDSLINHQNISLCDKIGFWGFPFSIGTELGLTVPLSSDEFYIVGKYNDTVPNAVFRSGIISYYTNNFFVINANSYFENKGSPVMTYDGELIGMVLSSIWENSDKTNSKLISSGLTYCLRIPEIIKYLEYLKKRHKW